MKRASAVLDKYALYEASVQAPKWDLKNLARIYEEHTGKDARLLREDFCSTAAICAAWTERHADNHAVGVDLDPEPLAWARAHRFPRVKGADRITLIEGNVCVAHKPSVDIACGLNFSWWIFKQRQDLLAYLKASRASLRPGGILVLNAFGGTDAELVTIEKTRKRSGTSIDGTPYPAFTYVWEHKRVNAIDRNLLAYIHFEVSGGRSIKKAFTYDWRLWTLPEVRDLALEAGFADFRIWKEVDGRLSTPRFMDNEDCWFANLVCYR
jgi:hypothetical protein